MFRLAAGLALGVLLAASGACGAGGVGSADCETGDCDRYGPVVAEVIESPRPYRPGAAPGEAVWGHLFHQDSAEEVALRFERADLAVGDELRVTAQSGAVRVFTRESPPGPLVRVPGPSALVEVVSFGESGGEGVRIPYVAYREPGAGKPWQAEDIPPGAAFRDVTCLKPGFPCAMPDWYASARATARIFIRRTNNTMSQCTGTLLDRQGRKDVLITARHCMVSASEILAEFGAEYGPDCQIPNAACDSPMHKDCEGTYYTGRFFYLEPTCDWGLVLLDGNPGEVWGTVPMASAPAETGAPLYLIQHPAGRCKEWDAGHISAASTSSCVLEFTGTHSAGGSSGSALRRQDGGGIIGILSTSRSGPSLFGLLPVIDKRVLDLAWSGGPPPGVNIAPRSTRVATSSDFSGEWTGRNAVDGVFSYESKWVSAAEAPPQWLKLDLGREYDVTGFALWAPSSVGESGALNPKAFSFQWAPSWDGPWTDEFDLGLHLHRERVSYRGFPGVTRRLRYVRLHVTEANQMDLYARVVEFAVYAREPRPVLHVR